MTAPHAFDHGCQRSSLPLRRRIADAGCHLAAMSPTPPLCSIAGDLAALGLHGITPPPGSPSSTPANSVCLGLRQRSLG